METLLSQIKSPADLKKLEKKQLLQVAAELREQIVATVAKNGGHLGSSLGVVELTIALHRVFDTPRDHIIWDVGHQAYAHKLLTGRQDQFGSLRQFNGMSGFPKRKESGYDSFGVGHSSTSISAALGMAAGRDICGDDNKVVAVIGDGSLTAGMAFEGLNHAGDLKKKLVVILNDNEMSISPNVGALSSFLSRKMTSDTFIRFKKETENLLGYVPGIGRDLVNLAKRAEESLKSFMTPGMLFEGFGFDYFGPIDGHNIEELVATLRNVAQINGPVLLHILTKKGKGYEPAELNPPKFHGVGPFDPATGETNGGKAGSAVAYTKVFSDTLIALAQQDERIVGITAAMAEGTGLKKFSEAFPERFFDVGIAEQHAVTFAAGLACQGLRPVVAIYSTFMQRAYDQVIHDVCLQNLPVTFALDRCGLVGADGPTHHGSFDLSFLRHIPNLILATPRNEVELQRIMKTASTVDGPFAYRYPRGNGVGLPLLDEIEVLDVGRGELLCDGSDGLIIAVGDMVNEALIAAQNLSERGLHLAVIDARFIKPLDADLILSQVQKAPFVVTAEENSLQGGFGSSVLELISDAGMTLPVERIGIPDRFIGQGTQAELRTQLGLSSAEIVKRVLQLTPIDTPKVQVS
ncbi:1-deoxy-D-xylulose-5-phosphate synthase [Desulfuromusa kysingii]|uniref:1-deoxy-D-xylulose-5-phosphate synthase n=1 Tax=Desulfuromusa kysingii TaxID=37625 RepID=A0A1H3YQL8_9BACT|nr:1-deoxy-D-xylulose-5-phosphate synthase [Desulfuromusa kysingii]SEA13677.1 1-deoxy-D-xylulose-5-phosphate synthase [Desulfuromusa kysingii]